MPLLMWRASYSVGVNSLDKQHAAILAMLNEYHAAMMAGQAQCTAVLLLPELVACARRHLDSESAIMSAMKWPDQPRHRAKNEEMFRQLLELAARQEAGDGKVCVELMCLMRDWYINHLQGEDHIYGSWIKGHSAR